MFIAGEDKRVMCGIVGYFSQPKSRVETAALVRMAVAIEHRGPDDSGVWVEQKDGIGIAHCRLSIIDLSLAGHQPMISPCNRYVLAYNGEIYNHIELRKQLESEGGNFNWRGTSDTETVLAALMHWGVEKALKKFNGMFAFAYWDVSNKTLFLARDRMGEKPLFYGKSQNTFLFSSELKGITAFPFWQGEIDRNVLSLYLRYNYVPAPFCIYKGINKLLPAHYVVIRDNGRSISKPRCYWNLEKIANTNQTDTHSSAEECVEELDCLLKDSIAKRMIADVPIGAFLSGGIDSSAVVALMQTQTNRPVKTFTIGFHEDGHNEAEHAKLIAAHIGTDHTEWYVTPEETLEVIPKLPSIWDEPFSDSSQIPTYLVSKLAKQHVTVSLSGDGGDELFCGYTRYTQGYRVWENTRHLPPSIRKTVAKLIRITPGNPLEKIMSVLPKKFQVPHLGDRLPKLANVIDNDGSGESYYKTLTSHWLHPSEVVLNSEEPKISTSIPRRISDAKHIREQMMYLDSLTYLPDDILTKVDRASMAVSLEGRIPLLDHRIVEFSWRIPMSMKFKSGKGKWLLREVLQRYVPNNLIERPKMGFGVPIESWLRGPLREWAEELLDESRLSQEGYFDPKPIRKLWDEHKTGKRRHHFHLWDVLMFQSWLESNRG